MCGSLPTSKPGDLESLNDDVGPMDDAERALCHLGAADRCCGRLTTSVGGLAALLQHVQGDSSLLGSVAFGVVNSRTKNGAADLRRREPSAGSRNDAPMAPAAATPANTSVHTWKAVGETRLRALLGVPLFVLGCWLISLRGALRHRCWWVAFVGLVRRRVPLRGRLLGSAAVQRESAGPAVTERLRGMTSRPKSRR